MPKDIRNSGNIKGPAPDYSKPGRKPPCILRMTPALSSRIERHQEIARKALIGTAVAVGAAAYTVLGVVFNLAGQYGGKKPRRRRRW